MPSYQSYIICGTPRSGSTLLCYLLEHAGCGQPDSYFRRQSIMGLARDLGVTHDGDLHSTEFSRRYVDAVIKEGRGGTGIFGLRVMYENLGEMCERLALLHPDAGSGRALIEAAFGRVLYIYLSREDKIAQAISLMKAEQSGLWHITRDGGELERTQSHLEPHYDGQRIGEIVRELEHDDAAWRAWFKTSGIDPLPLTYNGLSADPHGGLARVLDALGMDSSNVSSIPITTGKLADRQSQDWSTRFKEESTGA